MCFSIKWSNEFAKKYSSCLSIHVLVLFWTMAEISHLLKDLLVSISSSNVLKPSIVWNYFGHIHKNPDQKLDTDHSYCKKFVWINWRPISPRSRCLLFANESVFTVQVVAQGIYVIICWQSIKSPSRNKSNQQTNTSSQCFREIAMDQPYLMQKRDSDIS